MKKIIIGLLFGLVLLPSLTFAQANPNPQVLGPACTTLVNNMKMGSTDATTNGEVSLLQKFYIHNGYLNMPANVPLGFFGPLTRQATINFQNQYGIVPAFGFVGPLTRAMIKQLTCVGVVPPVAPNPLVPNNNPIVPVNPGVVNNPNVFGNNNVNPLNPVNPNLNSTTVVPVPNPNIPVPAPCGPGALFNTVTGAPCNPNPVPAVCGANSPASITVVSPNGGEKFAIDTAVDIKWTSCNLTSDTLRISLINQTNLNPAVIYSLVNQTGDDGFETVKITQPAGMPPFQLGANFKIRIDLVAISAQANLATVTDESDDFFIVQ